MSRPAEFLSDMVAYDVSEGTQTRQYQLAERFGFYSAVLGAEVWIEPGFIFDGESIPTFLHWLVPPFGQSKRGACAHDYLYRHAGYASASGLVPVSRETADKVYHELVTAKGLPKWRAAMRYRVLRLVGGAAWKANRKAA